MKGMKTLFLVMALSLVVATLWDSLPIIKTTIHAALDPTLGKLLDFHLNIGFIIIVAIFTLITTLLQKYMTDQQTLREIKEEQKLMQEEMKKYKEHPEKLMEFQKKSMELTFKAMPITMRPLIYTSIPFILFFRWFGDFFAANPVKILGMNWLLAYILFSIIISIILRKILKVH